MCTSRSSVAFRSDRSWSPVLVPSDLSALSARGPSTKRLRSSDRSCSADAREADAVCFGFTPSLAHTAPLGHRVLGMFGNSLCGCGRRRRQPSGEVSPRQSEARRWPLVCPRLPVQAHDRLSSPVDPARNVMGVEMQSLEAIWRFFRTPPPGRTCGPVSLDALHALQCWRVGHPGRAFKLVRTSPFQPSDQVRARLSHGLLDQGADEDLRLWCTQHSVATATLPSSA